MWASEGGIERLKLGKTWSDGHTPPGSSSEGNAVCVQVKRMFKSAVDGFHKLRMTRVHALI